MNFDDAYANAAHIPGAEAFPPRWAAEAETFRSTLAAQGRAILGLAYGDTPRQAMDLFQPEGPAHGLVVFVHGGYWLRFDSSYWSHLANGPLSLGYAVAMPSYDLCPTVRIAGITRQVARAIESAAARVDGPIRLTGHSAGGHLVARMTAPGLLSAATLARVARVLPISPVADLRPMMQTSMNADLKIDETEAQAESPVLHPAPTTPVTVWVGGSERPAFVEQAQSLAKAWAVPCNIAPGLHHFDIIDGLAAADSPMTKDLMD